MTQRWAVHKFGGASVRDAAGVRNLSAILKQLAEGTMPVWGRLWW